MRLQLNQTYKVNNVIENCFKIVITTYEVMRYDLKYLKSIKWRFIIIDEGHKLKNINTNISKYVQYIVIIYLFISYGKYCYNNLTLL